METYQAIKARHQADVDAFPLKAAFSNEQLAEMMSEWGLPNDKDGYKQIVSIGAGCFIRRKDIPAFNEMIERHEKEMKAFRKSRKELTQAFRYEFANHECQFSMNEEVVCNCVGLTWEEVKNDAELLKIFNNAYRLFWADAVKHNWF